MSQTTVEQDAGIVAAILCAMNDTGGTAIEGILYAGLMNVMDLPRFQNLIGALIGARLLVRHPGHVIEITKDGRDFARRLDAAAAATKDLA
jgi:predicted transcriptional regulator